MPSYVPSWSRKILQVPYVPLKSQWIARQIHRNPHLRILTSSVMLRDPKTSLPSIWVKREHTIGLVCSDRISRNWLGRSVVQQPLKSLILGSPGTGKNKTPVCVCVYVILCLRSYLYLLKPFSMQQMWIISKAAGDYLLHGLYSPRAFAHRACLRTRHCPSQWSSQSAVLSWTKILHTLICLGVARRCERPTRSHCPIRRLLLSHHPCVIPASRYAHNASHS